MRLEFRASSLEIAEIRLSSALANGGMVSFKIWRFPPGARDPWWGILAEEEVKRSELGVGVEG